MIENSSAEADLARLHIALELVQGELNRTMPEAPRLQVKVVPDSEWTDYHFTAYIAGPDDYWASGGGTLYGPTMESALFSVADGVQEYLSETTWTVWPICPQHRHGVHVRPPGTAPDWIYEGGGWTGHPVWWCRGGGGHDLAQIGQLDAPPPRGKRKRPQG